MQIDCTVPKYFYIRNKSRSKMKKYNGTQIAENGHLEICFRVIDEMNFKFIDFNFKHTSHSFLKASQRGISSKKLNAALQYGETIYKQGLIYFILGENNIPDSLIKEKDKLKNTVVVVAGDSNKVITCYRSANPFRNIKHKSKRVFNNYVYAA
jgi:hypothetical protein